jgi:hypothetical protein
VIACFLVCGFISVSTLDLFVNIFSDKVFALFVCCSAAGGDGEERVASPGRSSQAGGDLRQWGNRTALLLCLRRPQGQNGKRREHSWDEYVRYTKVLVSFVLSGRTTLSTRVNLNAIFKSIAKNNPLI